MWLEKLILHHFRNYEREEVLFGPETNIIQGENAQGKTNILEAISLLSTGKSFRTPHLQDLIRHGSSSFHVEAHFQKEGVHQTLSLSFDGNNRKIQHNQTSYSSFISLLGILPSVLIVPEDVSLVSGSPSDRRRFLDLHIAQIDPLYVYHLGRYYKALKQRNFLLKRKQESSLSSWEALMAGAAAYISLQRKKRIEQLSLPAKRFLLEISEQKDAFDLQYHSSVALVGSEKELSSLLYEQWQKNRKREMYVGSTLTGPHRDDLHLCINAKEAKLFGSEGQKRCCVAALRLAQRELFEEHLGSSPLMGIDDFGIHLDNNRSAYLLHHMEKLGQTFLTSPVNIFSFSSLSEKRYLKVSQGKVSPFKNLSDESMLALEGMS